MGYLSFESRYDRYPVNRIEGYDDKAYKGWDEIKKVIEKISENENILVCDTYPGVYDREVLREISGAFQPDEVIDMNEIFYDEETLTSLMEHFLTDDRVRGKMYYGTVLDFLDPYKLQEARMRVLEDSRKFLIYGFGASLVTDKGKVIYCDLARWEIQLRYRKGMPNFKQRNYDEDILRKYKRGYFVEWRIADRHKKEVLPRMDFYLDTNREEDPSMVEGKALLKAVSDMTERPYRMVPYFDPGVWGGQWMKEICHLDKDEKNFAWAFDGVPEENSMYYMFGDVLVESPAMNITLLKPRELLGERTFSRFGAEFPIRFDFLDTVEGQNLSLQVHPDTEYIREKFAMPYTQDESYYILYAKEDAGVYLGLKEDVDPKSMILDLEKAQEKDGHFDADKYVNFFPAKAHDHFLIPAGTVHCSSRNTMVLEISATPYIFTFKLWDWGRVGLDGIPRPIHIEDGKNVIRFDRTTDWVKENLINRKEELERSTDYTAERTGLHELEFIDTVVYTIHKSVDIKSEKEVRMYNLVEGESAVIESREGKFSSFEVHFAETFIVPAEAGDIIIRAPKSGKEIKVLRAEVRF